MQFADKRIKWEYIKSLYNQKQKYNWVFFSNTIQVFGELKK